MNMQQAVLSKISDCGYCDLELLEDIEYDLDDIIQDCIDNNDLSLHGIFRGVFHTGARDLQNAFDEQKDDIRDSILEALENEKTEWIDSGEMTIEELEDCEEHKELIADLELLNSDILNPEDDMDYFMNYTDTHVSMKHIDFYRRWMENDVENIESCMGWSFEEGDY